MKNRVVSATEFKAKCLALLDEVEETGHTITVTKRGKPVATVGPPEKKTWKSLAGAWKGLIEIPDEVLERDRTMDWNAVRDPESQL